MTETVEHECRQGKRCKSRKVDETGRYHGAGVMKQFSICEACESHAFEAIGKLGHDWSKLYPALSEPKLAAALSAYVSSSASVHSIPIRTDVDAVMVDIVSELVRWFRILTQGDELPDNTGECVSRCVLTLGASRRALVDLPPRVLPDWHRSGEKVTDIRLDGIDGVLRLAKLHARALSVLGETETRLWLADRCPRDKCGRKALSPSADQSRVTCQGCGAVWDSAHFALLGNVLEYQRTEAS